MRRLYIPAIATILFVLGTLTAASAADVSAFGNADISGLTLDKTIQSSDGPISYTLTVQPWATVNGYQIEFLQGIYILGSDPGFGATVGTSNSSNLANWSWDTMPKHDATSYTVAGWTKGEGNKTRLMVSNSIPVTATFSYGSLNIPSTTSVRLGLEIGYTVSPNQITTGHFTEEVPSVPEPGTIVASLTLLSPVAFMFRRRRVG